MVSQILEESQIPASAPILGREEIVRNVTAACQEVFTTMLGMEASPGEPYVQRNGLGSAAGIMSLIGLAGTWTGAGSIICSPECACRLASHLLMTEYSHVNHEVLDAVAELTNMIVGSFKALVEPHTGPLGLSIPSVVYGRNFTFCNGADEWTVVPFLGEAEQMQIRICLTPNRRPARNASGD